MQKYWFRAWLKKHLIGSERALRTALTRPATLDALLSNAPEPILPSRKDAPAHAELTGGKGIDLTGELGCRHVNCLKGEVDQLFRHTWHYFDRISLPDQALSAVLYFENHKRIEDLTNQLVPAMHAVNLIDAAGAGELVSFEPRLPSCFDHAEEHARQANILQAFGNVRSLALEISKSASISWEKKQQTDHTDLDFRLDHDEFEHSEWGTLCSKMESLPVADEAIRYAISTNVVQKYLAALSADALTARQTKTALGTAIPFYRRLLATHPTADVETIAFDLDLPVSEKIPIKTLIKLRREERPAFERFQTALRTAITERIKSAPSPNSLRLADEIKRDVIDPELHRVRDLLAISRSQAIKSGMTGVALGATAATIGLMTPLSSNPIGAGLAVGGAISLGLGSINKAVGDHLSTQKEVLLSDMYFLWKAHHH